MSETRDFIDGGDSGSAMLIPIAHPNDENQIALLVAGLFFARTSIQVGFACHFADIVKAFNLKPKIKASKLIRRWKTTDL